MKIVLIQDVGCDGMSRPNVVGSEPLPLDWPDQPNPFESTMEQRQAWHRTMSEYLTERGHTLDLNSFKIIKGIEAERYLQRLVGMIDSATRELENLQKRIPNG